MRTVGREGTTPLEMWLANAARQAGPFPQRGYLTQTLSTVQTRLYREARERPQTRASAQRQSGKPGAEPFAVYRQSGYGYDTHAIAAELQRAGIIGQDHTQVLKETFRSIVPGFLAGLQGSCGTGVNPLQTLQHDLQQMGGGILSNCDEPPMAMYLRVVGEYICYRGQKEHGARFIATADLIKQQGAPRS